MIAINRSALVFVFDLVCALVAWMGGFLLRFNFTWQPEYSATFWAGALWLLPFHALLCRWAGLYRGLWVFASLPDLKRLLRAIGGSVLALAVFVVMFHPEPAVPRSVFALYPMSLIMLMGGGRVIYRLWKEGHLHGSQVDTGRPVVVVGAGRTAAMLVRELSQSNAWRVVALLDDDRGKWGRDIGGCRVLGPISALAEVARNYHAKHAILAIPSASEEARRVATQLAMQAGVEALTVPRVEDVMAGLVTVSHVRRVEIDDLLGRDPVWIDTPHVQALLKDKVVVVTGAGGSIGSELCQQLARFQPAKLVLLEQSEYALYSIEQWCRQHRPGLPVVPILGDVKDRERLREIFRQHGPHIVFHAAAYKHVPMLEVDNAWQAVRNNVLGTYILSSVACEFEIERFILISTDKAVNPTNVMGATKRLAEMICQAMHGGTNRTQFEMVRFGNVLGSTGSVIPLFQEQIARGGPVTVTHPEITRYFMSVDEAVQLVLQAATMGEGGEIFVMEMGEPVRIVDLARNMIRLSGYTEDDIRIEYTGLRPGEKLYEELLADEEHTRKTPHPKLRVAKARKVPSNFLETVLPWLVQSRLLSDDEVKTALAQWIEEYQPLLRRPLLTVVDGGAAKRA